jgi:RNA polymerase sigma factor (sigma-70 family)
MTYHFGMERMGDLMARAQAGDAVAYRRLLDAARLWLTRWYRSRLPPGIVEDAVQDALIALHTKRATWDPARPFEPWLAAIARYMWIDRLRAMARRPEAELEDVHTTPADEGPAAASDLARLLALLKPAQAEVIRLTKVVGLSVEEASRATGQSVPLVKINVHRGLKRLARIVEERE